MASRSLGVLTLDLVVKAGAFTAGMTAAERQANKSLTAIEKRAYAFGRTVGASIKAGAVIATAALTAVAVAVGQAIDRADEMRDLSIRTGIATEKLSEYAYAAKQTGTDIDGLGRGLKILAKNAAEAADATSGKGKLFEALGINVKDAEGNLKQLDALLPEVADKFKQLEDGTTKAALAQELFGKSGLDLIEFLNQGSAGLQTAADKAKALGIVISTDTANAADEFNDKLGDLRAAVDGFALQLAAKLLPQLIELVDKINQFVGNGENATKIANGLANGVDLLAGAMGLVTKSTNVVNAAMGTFVGLLASATAVAQGLINLDFSQIGKGLAGGLAAIRAGADFAVNGAPVSKQKKFKQADFSDVRTRVQGQKTVEEMLADLFNGKGTKPPKAKSAGGKSEAEKEAEQLQRAYESLKASQLEQIALFGQVGEAAKIRYEIENGELAKLAPAKQQELLLQAQQIDSMKELDELEKAAKEARDDDVRSKEAGMKATSMLLEDMQFELDIMNLSNEAREKAIFLRGLDADATDAQRESASALFDELQRSAEMKDIMDDFKAGLSDAFVDFVTGAKSAKEAFGDFMDDLFKRAVQFTTDKAIDALFSAFGNGAQTGSTGGGGGGTDWMAIIAGFFGGGKAAGGPVKPWSMYEVNELGMEGLTVGGRDYLMTGAKGGTVTPAHRMGGSTYNLNNTFVVHEGNPQRTQEQSAQKMGQKVEEITRRNS